MNMSHADFDFEMNRLEKTWPNFYTQERKGAVWNVVKAMPSFVWRKIVGEIIMNMKHAPTPGDIQELVISSRQQYFERKKAEDRKLAEDFASGALFKTAPEEVKLNAEIIRRRLEGSIPEDEFQEWLKSMKAKTLNVKAKCYRCQDDSYIFWNQADYEYSVRCTCVVELV